MKNKTIVIISIGLLITTSFLLNLSKPILGPLFFIAQDFTYVCLLVIMLTIYYRRNKNSNLLRTKKFWLILIASIGIGSHILLSLMRDPTHILYYILGGISYCLPFIFLILIIFEFINGTYIQKIRDKTLTKAKRIIATLKLTIVIIFLILLGVGSSYFNIAFPTTEQGCPTLGYTKACDYNSSSYLGFFIELNPYATCGLTSIQIDTNDGPAQIMCASACCAPLFDFFGEYTSRSE